MDERKRFQFSMWNLMLMVLLWAVLFWDARQDVHGGPGVWIGVLVVGIAPAIGTLVAGWKGMGQGFGWLFLVYVIGSASALSVWLLAGFIEADLDGAPELPHAWSLVAALMTVIGPLAVGAMVSWRRGSEFWLDTGVVLAVLSVLLVFMGCLAVFVVRVAFHR